jgi:hypothetical protein
MTIKVETENVTSNSTGGATMGKAATNLISFYGAAPVSQRTATIQAASVVSVSSNITIAASLTAWIVEVTATLTGLGVWKGA